MARSVVWTELAWQDLERAVETIAQDSPTYAAGFARRIWERAQSLDELCCRGRVVPEVGDPDVRELIQAKLRLKPTRASRRQGLAVSERPLPRGAGAASPYAPSLNPRLRSIGSPLSPPTPLPPPGWERGAPARFEAQPKTRLLCPEGAPIRRLVVRQPSIDVSWRSFTPLTALLLLDVGPATPASERLASDAKSSPDTLSIENGRTTRKLPAPLRDPRRDGLRPGAHPLGSGPRRSVGTGGRKPKRRPRHSTLAFAARAGGGAGG
jgi:plasmid stabilization system protein ParE